MTFRVSSMSFLFSMLSNPCCVRCWVRHFKECSRLLGVYCPLHVIHSNRIKTISLSRIPLLLFCFLASKLVKSLTATFVCFEGNELMLASNRQRYQKHPNFIQLISLYQKIKSENLTKAFFCVFCSLKSICKDLLDRLVSTSYYKS